MLLCQICKSDSTTEMQEETCITTSNSFHSMTILIVSVPSALEYPRIKHSGQGLVLLCNAPAANTAFQKHTGLHFCATLCPAHQ